MNTQDSLTTAPAKGDKPRVTVVSSGLSSPSTTRQLADALAESVAKQFRADDGESGVEIITLEARDMAVDLATHMVTGTPSPTVDTAKQIIADSDALIAVSPVFKLSYPGIFKMFFDALDNKALFDVPVIIAATGGSPRHSLMIEHSLRPLFAYFHSIIVPTGVFAATEDFGATGGSSSLSRRIDQAAGELVSLLQARPLSSHHDDALEPHEGENPSQRSSGLGLQPGGPSFEALLKAHDGSVSGKNPPSFQ